MDGVLDSTVSSFNAMPEDTWRSFFEDTFFLVFFWFFCGTQLVWLGLVLFFLYLVMGGWLGCTFDTIDLPFYFFSFLSFFRESGTAREIDARFLSDVLRLRSCGIDGSVMI